MFEGAVDPADALDAARARILLVRVAPMLRQHRRVLIVCSVLIVAWVAGTLAGPFLVRYGIDRGLGQGDAGALSRAVAGYVVVALGAYVVYRLLVVAVSRV